MPKITCRSSPGITLNANASEINLKDPSASQESVFVISTDVRVEEDAGNFYVCGAAYGGVTYDDFTMSADPSGNFSYSYKGNAYARAQLYFTNSANTSSNSYMTITHSQTCK